VRDTHCCPTAHDRIEPSVYAHSRVSTQPHRRSGRSEQREQRLRLTLRRPSDLYRVQPTRCLRAIPVLGLPCGGSCIQQCHGSLLLLRQGVSCSDRLKSLRWTWLPTSRLDRLPCRRRSRPAWLCMTRRRSRWIFKDPLHPRSLSWCCLRPWPGYLPPLQFPSAARA
jgi:hypothetical protein